MATGTTKRTATSGTTRKTASKKPAAAAAPAAKKAALEAPKPVVVTAASPAPGTPELRKKELLDLVVEQSGVKRKDAKPAVEAMLAILGATIAEGREFNLQPFGKLRINRAEERTNGRITVCKLRQAKPGAGKSQEDEISPEDPLAEVGT